MREFHRPTRRQYLQGTAIAGAATLLAGCADEENTPGPDDSAQVDDEEQPETDEPDPDEEEPDEPDPNDDGDVEEMDDEDDE